MACNSYIVEYPNNPYNYTSPSDAIHRSCQTHAGELISSGKRIYLVQAACNGYSENGLKYDGKSFRVPYSTFKAGKTIAAEDYNLLRDRLNRELARRADYNESTGTLVSGTAADDRGEWHDDDFDDDHVDFPKATAGTYVEAKQANALIQAFLSKIDTPQYHIKKNFTQKNAQKQQIAKMTDVAAGDIAYCTQLSAAAQLLYYAQKECACYADCDGYSVCYCYNHCSNY